jgi:tetratricopeptide (TPR) repeat protein
VQFLGVTANDVVGWNARIGYRLRDANDKDMGTTFDEKEYAQWNAKLRRSPRVDDRISMNIDELKNRQRLWSFGDNQLAYCLQTLAPGFASRQSQMLNARQDWNHKLAESYLLIARAYHSAGQGPMAMACCDWALDLDPGHQEAILLTWELASVYHRNVGGIAQRLRQSLLHQPEDVAKAIYLGFVFVEQGDAESALRSFEDGLRRSPSKFPSRFEAVRRYFEQRLNGGLVCRPSSAIRRDLSAVTDILKLYVQGRGKEQMGQLDDAEEAYRQADQRWPGLADTKAHLARILALKEDANGSLAILRSKSEGN